MESGESTGTIRFGLQLVSESILDQALPLYQELHSKRMRL